MLRVDVSGLFTYLFIYLFTYLLTYFVCEVDADDGEKQTPTGSQTKGILNNKEWSS